MQRTASARFAWYWQEYRGAVVALLVAGWLVVATVTVFFLGITPSEPSCHPIGPLGLDPMDPQAREALCAQLRGFTRVEWQASLTTL